MFSVIEYSPIAVLITVPHFTALQNIAPVQEQMLNEYLMTLKRGIFMKQYRQFQFITQHIFMNTMIPTVKNYVPDTTFHTCTTFYH